MSETASAIITLLVFVVLPIIAIVLTIQEKKLRSPFKYPYYAIGIDISNKRGPEIDDLLDTFLIEGGFDLIQEHQNKIEQWKLDCEQQIKAIEKVKLQELRKTQYQASIDDAKAYKFNLTRSQTRYKTINYERYPYKVDVTVDSFSYSYDYIQQRYNELKSIDFECTLRAYHCKNQRKLATRKVREEIMVRDNYTCQICGKYMPDEVGLQIDHIIPVSKGGKTIPSNLRVLCSKCNGSKSNKMPY